MSLALAAWQWGVLGLLLIALEAFWARGWLLGCGLGAMTAALFTATQLTFLLPAAAAIGLILALIFRRAQGRAEHELLVTREHLAAKRRDDSQSSRPEPGHETPQQTP